MSTIKVNDLLKAEALESLIEEIRVEGIDRARKLHLAAVSALQQAVGHGNLDALTRLYHAFGPAENANEFKFWVSVFTKRAVTWDKDSKAFKQKAGKKVQGVAKVTELIEHQGKKIKATSCAWWNLPEVNANREFDPNTDVKGMVSSLLSRAKKARDGNEEALAGVYESMARQFLSGIDNKVNTVSRETTAKLWERVGPAHQTGNTTTTEQTGVTEH